MCPHCRCSFFYLNQHWAQNPRCGSQQELISRHRTIVAAPPPVAAFASHQAYHSDESQASCNFNVEGDDYPLINSDHSDAEAPSNDFTVLAPPTSSQLPGISLIPLVQLPTESQWIHDFGTLAMADNSALDDFGHDDESSYSSNVSSDSPPSDDIGKFSSTLTHVNQPPVLNDTFPIIDVSQYIGTNRFIFQKSEIAYMRIWDFVDRMHAPLYAFDDLLVILREEALSKRFDATAVHPSRQSFFKKMIAVFGNGVLPKCVTIDLEIDDFNKNNPNYERSCLEIADIFVFDATEQAVSLLQDMGIMSDINNLAVNLLNPFGRYMSPDGRLGEVNSGKWYDRAYNNLINSKAEPPEFLIGVILYCDKTGTTVQQRHGLEPVMMTFTLFTEPVRNQTFRAWRPIGYIPDLEQGSSSEKRIGSNPAHRGRKCRNYHACQGVVLSSLEKLITEGIVMYLTLGTEARKVHLKFSVALYMGDGKSSDMLCCRVPNYKQARTSRACYVSFENLGTPRDPDSHHDSVDCHWVLQKEQRKLLVGCQEEGKEEDSKLRSQLAKVSTIRCDSPLFRLCYGGSPFGQYMACSVDMMHAFEHGVVVYVLKSFVSAITGPKKKKIDTLVRYMFANHRCSEKDTYPRTNFTKGVTHLKLMKCYEWTGFLLVFLVLAQSYQGSDLLSTRMDDKDGAYIKRMDRRKRKQDKKQNKTAQLKATGHSTGFDSRPYISSNQDNDDVDDINSDSGSDGNSDANDDYDETESETDIVDIDESADTGTEDFQARCTFSDFVTLMSQLLTFHAYYKQKTFWKKSKAKEGERKLNYALMIMLQQLRRTLHRDDGYGWNVHKVHEVFFHLVRQIRETGRPSNCDCQVGERGLKVWGKNDGKRTNKGSVSSFTGQVAQRIYEHSVIARAQNGMDYISKKMSFHQTPTETVTNVSFMVGQPKYKVVLQSRKNAVTGRNSYTLVANWAINKTRKGKPSLPLPILQLFKEEYFSISNDTPLSSFLDREICGYTEYNHKGKVYRSHPNPHNVGEWYDWVVLKCPNNEVDGRYSNLSVRSERRRSQKESVAPINSSCVENTYGRGSVPARIVALYRDPITGVDKAIVHACRPMMELNVERSSVIQDSWHLQHFVDYKIEKDPRSGTLLVPLYNIVLTSSFIDRIRVFMECREIENTWLDIESSGHVISLAKRSTHWSASFTSHESDSSDEELE
jgi:hypothetical protein